MVLSEIFAYYIGKSVSRSRTNRVIDDSEGEDEMTPTQDWSSFDQDTRTFEQLLQEAREHRANKDNQ
jgi:hypothetical protein